MTNPKKSVRPASPAKPALSPEQQKALEDEMRNNQMIARRAQLAMNLLPSIIRSYPDMCEEEMVEKASRIAESALDKLLGVTFTKNEPKE